VQRTLPLTVFIVVVLGGGSLIGTTVTPGPWYEALEKPWFNPPNWLFGPVWSVLYVIIAIAGWRNWRQAATSRPMWIWWLQLALNFAWSPLFFGAQQTGLALAVIVALLAAILAFIALAWNRDRASALLFIPYAAWVAFASLLNGSIWWLN
jgi:tryptophan-rich sensory protein